MSNKLIPTRVKIDGKWYNAREGWGSTTGMLELCDSGKISQITEFTAKEPYGHMNDFYFVFDTDGNKVGEIDINNKSCSGRVGDFEIPGNYSAENSGASSGNSRHFPRRDESAGCLAWIFGIFFFLLFSNWGGRIGVILGVIFIIITLVTDSAADGLNGIFLGLFATFLFGIVGAAIGGIIGFIRKQINK
jgi:hypothetical protein